MQSLLFSEQTCGLAVLRSFTPEMNEPTKHLAGVLSKLPTRQPHAHKPRTHPPRSPLGLLQLAEAGHIEAIPVEGAVVAPFEDTERTIWYHRFHGGVRGGS